MNIKTLLMLGSLLLLVSCSSIRSVDSWPADLPDSRLFVQAWQADANNQDYQEQAEYLLWVQRFFTGFNLAPGWYTMIDQVMKRVEPGQRPEVRAHLEQLGVRVGQEWAKHNKVRRINTRIVATWRDALLESLSQHDLDHYLVRLDQDVSALLAGELDASEIAFERYYVDEFDI